jgi:transcriptional antiterminator RfaH
MSDAQPWFTLQTKPRHERNIERQLSRKGYECFTPTYRLKRKWSDRVVEIDFPLFPTYVFCRLNPSVLGQLLSIRGVVRVVGFGGRPVEVDVEEVESLQLLARSSLLREPWKYLPDGIVVLVETGPLAGIQGIIRTDENRRQLIISITLLQRSVAIHLDKDTVVSVVADPAIGGMQFSGESYLAVNLLRNA